MSTMVKSCACCLRACPKGTGLCPTCVASGCARKKNHWAYARGPQCPVKVRGRNGARASNVRRIA